MRCQKSPNPSVISLDNWGKQKSARATNMHVKRRLIQLAIGGITVWTVNTVIMQWRMFLNIAETQALIHSHYVL